MRDFTSWFAGKSSGMVPHKWQAELGGEPVCRNRLIHIPTGMGKTAGALAAWAYNRLERQDDTWPRRLIWCLPMRVLVEQTEQTARDFMHQLGRDADAKVQGLLARHGPFALAWLEALLRAADIRVSQERRGASPSDAQQVHPAPDALP